MTDFDQTLASLNQLQRQYMKAYRQRLTQQISAQRRKIQDQVNKQVSLLGLLGHFQQKLSMLEPSQQVNVNNILTQLKQSFPEIQFQQAPEPEQKTFRSDSLQKNQSSRQMFQEDERIKSKSEREYQKLQNPFLRGQNYQRQKNEKIDRNIQEIGQNIRVLTGNVISQSDQTERAIQAQEKNQKSLESKLDKKLQNLGAQKQRSNKQMYVQNVRQSQLKRTKSSIFSTQQRQNLYSRMGSNRPPKVQPKSNQKIPKMQPKRCQKIEEESKGLSQSSPENNKRMRKEIIRLQQDIEQKRRPRQQLKQQNFSSVAAVTSRNQKQPVLNRLQNQNNRRKKTKKNKSKHKSVQVQAKRYISIKSPVNKRQKYLFTPMKIKPANNKKHQVYYQNYQNEPQRLESLEKLQSKITQKMIEKALQKETQRIEKSVEQVFLEIKESRISGRGKAGLKQDFHFRKGKKASNSKKYRK